MVLIVEKGHFAFFILDAALYKLFAMPANEFLIQQIFCSNIHKAMIHKYGTCFYGVTFQNRIVFHIVKENSRTVIY